MISFDNTENAFKSKSNKNLKQSYWLFKLIGNPAIVNLGAALGPLSLKIGFKRLIKNTIFKQFVGGESITECNNAIEELSKYNIGTILDYSVEGKESEQDFEKCFNETIRTIEKAYNDKNIPFCVFKVTGLARFVLLEKISLNQTLTETEKIEWQNVEKRVNTICETAANKNQAIFVDAEESWIQPAIDELVNKNMAIHNKQDVIVYNTYQLYRHDRLTFLQNTLNDALKNNYKVGAKLVRGAYMEKERKRAIEKNYTSPIQPNKQNSDNDYNNALTFCVENINSIALCAGTHNEESSLHLVNLMQKHNLTPNDKRIYFSQLYGMSDHISYNLSLNNYNVAKYVPYGPVNEVLPYLIRRAQENTSVKGQTGRELNLILKEKKRRSL